MHRFLLILLVVFFVDANCISAQGQRVFKTVPKTDSTACADCDDPINYAPLVAGHTPLKNVRIVIHILQRTDSVANFENTPKDIIWINFLARRVNLVMSCLDTMQLPTESPYIRDTRIRYVVDTIYFHQNNIDWDMYCPKHSSKKCKLRYSKGKSLYRKYVIDDKNMVHRDSAIHLFWGENSAGKGMASGIGDKKWIMICGFYVNYIELHNFWTTSGLFRHELGHSLGLFHTSSGSDKCDDTPNHKTGWDSKPPANNMMDYNSSKKALTECQIGRMHYYLTGKAGTVGDALIRDFCVYDSSTIVIRNGEDYLWKCEKYLKGNLKIEAGATLTIKCKTSFPRAGRLIIEEGGKLILDYGILTNVCGDIWHGVEIVGNRSARKKPIRNGIIVIKNGGKIENAINIPNK